MEPNLTFPPLPLFSPVAPLVLSKLNLAKPIVHAIPPSACTLEDQIMTSETKNHEAHEQDRNLGRLGSDGCNLERDDTIDLPTLPPFRKLKERRRLMSLHQRRREETESEGARQRFGSTIQESRRNGSDGIQNLGRREGVPNLWGQLQGEGYYRRPRRRIRGGRSSGDQLVRSLHGEFTPKIAPSTPFEPYFLLFQCSAS